MNHNLSHRKATLDDLPYVIGLLLEDELAQTREHAREHTANSLLHNLDPRYVAAFHAMDKDPNHYLMVVEQNFEIIATCHLTLIASISFIGSTRLQIEEVRVSEKYRSQGIGEWVINAAIDYGRARGAKIVQLTTNKKRDRAKVFYERIGFQASHEGLKLYLD